MLRAAVVLCVLIGVCACSDSSAGSGPGSLAPVTSSGTATPSAPPPSPSRQPLVVPEPPAAAAATRQGAEAFARYWFEVLNASYAAVDATAVQRISAPDCVTCSNYLGSLNLAVREGKTYKGGDVRVIDVASAPLEGDKAAVLVSATVPPMQVYDRAGAFIREVAGEDKFVVQVELRRREASWIVTEVART